MTDNNDDLAFTDKVDPYQARQGRREALGIALHLIDKETDSAETLIEYATQIDAYLEDGSTPGDTEAGSLENLSERVSGMIRRDGVQSIHR